MTIDSTTLMIIGVWLLHGCWSLYVLSTKKYIPVVKTVIIFNVTVNCDKFYKHVFILQKIDYKIKMYLNRDCCY